MIHHRLFVMAAAAAGMFATLALPGASVAQPSVRKESAREAARTSQVSAEQDKAARRMDERIARHDADARRAMSGICAGC
jgi:hypothetical protein